MTHNNNHHDNYYPPEGESDCTCESMGPPMFIPCARCEPELHEQWFAKSMQAAKDFQSNHRSKLSETTDDEIPY